MTISPEARATLSECATVLALARGITVGGAITVLRESPALLDEIGETMKIIGDDRATDICGRIRSLKAELTAPVEAPQSE